MSKKIGKIFKKAAKAVSGVAGAALGTVTGTGSGLSSILGGGSIDSGVTDLAKTQAAIAQQQADQAAQEQRYQAQAAAQQIQLDNDKAAAQAAAESAQQVDTTQVDVAPSTGDDQTSAARRKRFNATSVGAGGSNNGPAIRI